MWRMLDFLNVLYVSQQPGNRTLPGARPEPWMANVKRLRQAKTNKTRTFRKSYIRNPSQILYKPSPISRPIPQVPFATTTQISTQQRKQAAMIQNLISKYNLIENEPMSRHTSFRIGGPADLYVSPAASKGLSGMEFAAGIPGSIGGAVVMNAGAYGGEMKDIIVDASVITKEGAIRTLSLEELDLSYRHSSIIENEYIVIGARLKLHQEDEAKIRQVMDDLRDRRVEKQPLNFPSAGSTFKRPEGYFAGKLIMDAGLRGYTVGGAQVSEKHCGFVVNKGGATASDVVKLMNDVKNKVMQEFGVELEPEVKMIGEFK